MKDLRPMLFFGLLIVAGVLWQLFSLYLDQATITNFPARGSHIIALGDSLTSGVGASSPERGYVGHLEKRLGVIIENRGVSGNTTRDGLERLKSDVLDANPDIVMILLGGNDYLRRIPESETFANLRIIITEIHKTGAVVLLVGIRGGLLADKFADNFESLATETGSAFVPNVLDSILGDPKLMSDQIHPNDLGYERITDKLAPTLQLLLPKS